MAGWVGRNLFLGPPLIFFEFLGPPPYFWGSGVGGVFLGRGGVVLLDLFGKDVVCMGDVVAVYGTLRSGGSNARWWRDTAVAEPGFRLDGYRLVMKRGLGFPCVVEDADSFVSVDLLWPLPGCGGLLLRDLDVLEGYPRLFGRRRVVVSAVDGGCSVDLVDGCWLYVPAEPELLTDLVDVGSDWLEFWGG